MLRIYTRESKLDREQSGDMQQVSAIASSSRDYIDTTLPIAESDETHVQGAIVHGGDIGKVYEHVQQLDNENKYSLLKKTFVPKCSCNYW